MADSNRYSGAITITPPLTATEIRSAPTSVLEDCRLRVAEDVTQTADGEAIVHTADAIEPTCSGFSGRNLVEDLQLLVDHLGLLTPPHTFGGHIEVHWDNGYGEPPARYVVVDGRVKTVVAQFAWPGNADLGSFELVFEGTVPVVVDGVRVIECTTYDPERGGWRRRSGDPSRLLVNTSTLRTIRPIGAAETTARAAARPVSLSLPLHFADREHLTRGVCGATGETAGLQVALDPGDDRIDCRGCRTWLASRERKPEEWCAIYGVQVYDPDGWRGVGAPDWHDDALGLREFHRRAVESTTNMAATGAAERIRCDLAFLPQDAASVAAGGA